MSRSDAQREEDARQRRELKEAAKRLQAERIAKHWANDVRSPVEIAGLVGCSVRRVSDVLAELGLRPKQRKQSNRRPTLGALIRRVRK